MRTWAQTDAILCAPGMPHELEPCRIASQSYRVYKNLPPSLREFWLDVSVKYEDRTYIVFEHQRWTYRQIAVRALKAASLYRHHYHVRKGDRVGICSRNVPDYLVAFWACNLIGAVSVLVNALLPSEALRYCLAHTQCKLIILDPERADLLEPITPQLIREAGTTAFLVLESHEGKGYWMNMNIWNDVLDAYQLDIHQILDHDPGILPEDNATVTFTSGTTGLPKGCLSTQRMFLTNLINVSVGHTSALLRRGEPVPAAQDRPQKGVLVSVPLFHVSGLTGLSMMATMSGMKVVLIRRWDPEQVVRLIKDENIGVAGGVPSMVSDLIDNSFVDSPLDTLLFGGSPAPEYLAERGRQAFPDAMMSQAYGLTEINGIAVTVAGEDYLARPTTTGRPTPVNDVMIVDGGVSMPAGQVGEVWLRGPNVMKEYWHDPDATAKVITKDGWLRTGDLGLLDKEGFLYIRDRIKDVIIRGGENIDSVSVENALYADPRVSEAAAVGVPDKRLGELVVAVVFAKPAFYDKLSEAELIATAQKSLPRFAVPAMVIVQRQPFERTPSGKILKDKLRKIARIEWEKRCLGVAVSKL